MWHYNCIRMGLARGHAFELLYGGGRKDKMRLAFCTLLALWSVTGLATEWCPCQVGGKGGSAHQPNTTVQSALHCMLRNYMVSM